MTEEDWEQSLKNVNEDTKKWVDEEIFKAQYGVVKNIIQRETQMNDKQPKPLTYEEMIEIAEQREKDNEAKMKSYSQCPGECYDEFWKEENNQPTFNIDELTKGKVWNGKTWVEQTTQYRIDYYYKNDLERRWQYHKTMPMAIAAANLMIAKGDYHIESITTEQLPMGQD